MKEKYKKMYAEWKPVFQKFIDNNLSKEISGPLLISPPPLYYKQKNKIMIIGQETNGWNSEWKNDKDKWIEKQMEHTEKFNLGKNYTSSPFWNYFRKFENLFENDEYSQLWTNLHKFDLKSSILDSKCKEKIKALNKILIEEIEIGQPDICVFHTSYSRDGELKEIFEGIEFIEVEGWDIKWLALLKHSKLPQFSIRSYHPKYIRMKKKEVDFFESIKKIKENIK